MVNGLSSVHSLVPYLIVSVLLTVPVYSHVLPCKLHLEEWVQAVMPSNDTLYLIVDSVLYRLPFSESHISNTKQRIKLFGDKIKMDDHWTKANKLKSLSGIKLSYYSNAAKFLVQLNFLPVGGKSKVPYVDVIVGPETSPNYMEHFLVGGDPLKVHKLGNSTDKYAVISDGAKGGYILRMGEDWQPEHSTLTKMVPVKRVKNNTLSIPSLHWIKVPSEPFTFQVDPTIEYFRVEIPETNKLKFREVTASAVVNPSLKTRPVKTSKMFGFTFRGYIHLWDFKNTKVFIFKDPESKPQVVPVTTVRMGDYFACTEADWNVGTTNSSTTTVNPNGHVFLQLAIITAVLILFILLAGSICWCIFSRPKRNLKFKKQSRRLKYVSSARSYDSRSKPSTTLQTSNRSPGTSKDRTRFNRRR